MGCELGTAGWPPHPVGNPWDPPILLSNCAGIECPNWFDIDWAWEKAPNPALVLVGPTELNADYWTD